jgi:hypothetical protein
MKWIGFASFLNLYDVTLSLKIYLSYFSFTSILEKFSPEVPPPPPPLLLTLPLLPPPEVLVPGSDGIPIRE